MMLRVILELGRIPEGAEVVKIGGTHEFSVKDKIVIYADDPELTQTIGPGAGYRFIIDHESHSISRVEVSKFFVWHASLEELNERFGEDA